MSKLSIYRASAGSGKTYTLTREYLQLVFKDPLQYKSILAVTFTNKATDEMKSRILKEIYILSRGKESPYAEELCAQNKLTKEELPGRAKEILNRLLHDYSRFSVTTIDSFFQKVVRSFTREIGLQMGYNIELDQSKVLNEVVDLLLLEVDKDKQLRNWLSAFAESKIKEGKTWNFKQDILGLGNEVFKEDFKNFSNSLIKKLSDKQFLSSYRKILAELKQEFEDEFAETGKRARAVMDQHGLQVADFSYGKTGIAGYLSGLGKGGKMEPGSRVRSAIDAPDKWTTAKAKPEQKQAVETAVHAGLNELAKHAVRYYDEQGMLYRSTDKTLSYLYTLGILTDLSKKIQEYSENENLFLLSDASRLLRNIIGENDSPFVYEKIGNSYQHFMIDEFQDTSSMQWENFRPLLSNSLAEDQHSLVVGDVKQSIYRWRNGDWNLLASQLEEDFKSFGTNAMTLDCNWRSSKTLIDFNNTVFALSAQILQQEYNASIPPEITGNLQDEQQKIVEAYQDVCQKFPEQKQKKPGYVRVNFVEKEKDRDWTELVLEDVPARIEELQEKGYKAGDIAILVRNGKEGGLVAGHLMRYRESEQAKAGVNYDVISNDSLYLKSSSAVNFLTHVLHYFIYPEEKLNNGFLLHEYQVYLKDLLPEDKDFLFASFDEQEENQPVFPVEFWKQVAELKKLPLYDLVERLISIFDLNSHAKHFPFLEAFQDLVLNFTKTDAPDLHSFLQYWDERKGKEVISVSDQQDAIRIITIHKSKGLEFKAVLLPFCNWELDNTRHANILWCQPKVEGFDVLDILPVRYSSGLKDTIYYQEYFTEKLHSYIDNLNLLYVAQTRAEEVFISYSMLSGGKQIKTVGDVLQFSFENAENYSSDFFGTNIVSLSNYWNSEKHCFEMGELAYREQEKPVQQKGRMQDYPAFLLDERLKLKSHSADYFNFEETESVETFSPVNRGTILHQLFQLIHYKEDLDKAVAQLQFEGKLDEKQAEEVAKLARNFMNEPTVSGWFSKDWTVSNERDILLGEKGMQRPDRVIYKGKSAIVIDYKFGEQKLKSHVRQVQTYKNLIQQLGFDQVEAFVVYGKDSEIVSV